MARTVLYPRPMFPIGDENERGHGPAYVTLAIIGLNVLVFLLLQGAGGTGREPSSRMATAPFRSRSSTAST